MKLCPSCQFALPAENYTCHACGWEHKNLSGIHDFLSKNQRKDKTQSSYNENYEKLAKQNIEKSNIDRKFLRKQAKKLMEYIDDVRGLRVCEVGIGQGFICDELLARGAQHIVAVDVAISFLRRFVDNPKVETCLANVETLPFKNEFDLVISTDVFEHVLNAGSFLYCVNRALVDSGVVAVRVPYREGLMNYSPHCGYNYEFGHMRSFNKDILRIYFEQAGFSIVSMHLDGYSPYMPRNWAMNKKTGRILVYLLHKYVDKKLNHWSDVIDLPKPVVKTLLRPVEIVVVAKKTKDISEIYNN